MEQFQEKNESGSTRVIASERPQDELLSMQDRLKYLSSIKNSSREFSKILEEEKRNSYYTKFPEFMQELSRLEEEPAGLFFNVEEELRGIEKGASTTSESRVEVNESGHHERFLQNLERFSRSLSAARTVETYGTEKETLSSGRSVSLESLIWDKEESLMDIPAGDHSRNVSVVCRDEGTGSILGLRLSTLSNKDEKDTNGLGFTAKGFIIVDQKGEGVASAIERAYQSTLQAIATEEQRQFKKIGSSYEPEVHIRLVAENKNIEDLLKLKSSLHHAQTEGVNEESVARIEDSIRQKTSEQKGWLQVYGDGGKLGMSKVDNGSKYFVPGQAYSRQRYEKLIHPSEDVLPEKRAMAENELDSLRESIQKSLEK